MMTDRAPDLPPPPPPGTQLERALELYELGFVIIPLGDPWSTPPPSVHGATEAERRANWCKRPRVEWKRYQHTPPTETQIRDWFTRWPNANIGVLTGRNPETKQRLVVVDADSQDADAWLEHSSEVATTPVMTRTSRGRHRWYRMPDDLTITNQASSSKIDIRGEGGYVVAPGSTYGDGTLNEWIVAPGWDLADFDQLPLLTSADLGAIQRFGGRWAPTDVNGDPVGAQGEDILADLGAVRMPHDGEPVTPGGRNNALASLCGTWVANGFSIDRLLREARAWNAGNPVPLADHEVVHTVVSILTSHIRNHGTQPHKQEIRPSGLKVMSRGDSRTDPPEIPPTYWRDGVLFEGARLLIAGPPKVGKSNLVIQLALAAACGGEFLGASFERPLRVLWLQAEIREGFIAPRLERLERALSAEERAQVDQNFLYTDRCDLDLLDGPSYELVERVVREQAPEILIIDPIINFSSVDENDNAEMRRLLRLVDALGERNGCATVLVHHTRKDVAAGSFDAIRGASALRGWFDSGLLLTGQPGDAQAILSYELRNARALPASTLERTEEGRFVPMDLEFDPDGESPEVTVQQMRAGNAAQNHANHTSAEPPNRTNRTPRNRTTAPEAAEERKQNVFSLLERQSSALPYQELQQRVMKVCHVSAKTAERDIHDLLDEGRIVRIRQGRMSLYQVAPGGGNDD